ncbi:uncharacterized protein [Haliotis cracherodii]|uniref:uncharacterized protein n=1 Tax=Haliotis cracherodii TaxID=6455 RepID=UPI0039EA1F83
MPSRRAFPKQTKLVKSCDNREFNMHGEEIRFAPEWCVPKWFQKPREERLAFLGVPISLGKSRALETTPIDNTDNVPSPAVNERPRTNTATRFREMVKSAAAEYALEDAEFTPSTSNLNADAGNLIGATHTETAQRASEKLEGDAKLSTTRPSDSPWNVLGEHTQGPMSHTKASKWTQMAMLLQDADGDPVQHLMHFCPSPEPSPRQQPRSRWTQQALTLLEKDSISPSLTEEVVPQDVLEKQGSTGSFSGDTPSKTFFKTLFGLDFEIPTLYELINPPIIPSSMVKSDALKNGAFPVVLGRGSFGRVIRANLTDSQGHTQNIVVKEIFDCKNNVDAIFEEARMMLYLSRTGYVPSCFGVVSEGVGEATGILMECVGDGLTLERYLWDRKGRLAPICLLHIARQLAEGLREIHSLGVLLNDIKANNVLLDITDGIPKVKYCDFGQARYRHGVTISRRVTDNRYLYLAPEVRNGGVSCMKSDVHSVGFLFMVLSDFGGSDALAPAVKRCMVEDINLRINAEDLALMVDKIFNDHLEIFVLPDGRIQTNLGMSAFGEGDRTGQCSRDKMGNALGENENVLPASILCRSRTPSPQVSVNLSANLKSEIAVLSDSKASSSMDKCITSMPVYEAHPSSSSSSVSSKEPITPSKHRVPRSRYRLQRDSAPCLSPQYDADDELSGDESQPLVTSRRSPSLNADDELSGDESQPLVTSRRSPSLNADDELSCNGDHSVTTSYWGRCSVSPGHVSSVSLDLEDPIQSENFESMSVIILFIVFMAMLLKLFLLCCF